MVEADKMIKAVQVRIRGRVQGVGYREWTRGQAMDLGLDGWVLNEADGSVSALIAGPEATVDVLLERFWQGPSWASVLDVIAEAAATAEVPPGFSIRR